MVTILKHLLFHIMLYYLFHVVAKHNIFIAVSSVLDKGLQWSPQNKDQPKLIKEPLPKQGAISVAWT